MINDASRNVLALAGITDKPMCCIEHARALALANEALQDCWRIMEGEPWHRAVTAVANALVANGLPPDLRPTVVDAVFKRRAE